MSEQVVGSPVSCALVRFGLVSVTLTTTHFHNADAKKKQSIEFLW